MAVGAPADGMSIVPTRRADRAGASSMILIECDSISVSDAARGDKTSAGGGSGPVEAGGASVMAPINRPEPTALHSIVSGSSSVPTGPQPRGQPRPAHYRHRLHRHRLRAGRDGGRIIVTELSTLRLPVVAEMSRAQWPSSPTARSCGCLHRGSNAQVVS